jgi:Ca2+-binding RTX toxin-like protein
MRKGALLLVSAVVALLVASGVAWAATIRCPGPEEGSKCVGTAGTDTMYGIDHDVGYGGDWIVGREGADKIYGRGGADRTTDSGGGLHG